MKLFQAEEEENAEAYGNYNGGDPGQMGYDPMKDPNKINVQY